MTMNKIKIPEAYKYICAFLTMRCNLDCSFCLNAFSKSFDRKGWQEISGSEWVNALNKIDSRDDVPVTFSGGEPMLHKDFIHILNNLKPGLNIDILTNLSYEKGVESMLKNVNPERIKRNSPYASIRVSYHPEHMDAEKLVSNAKRMKDAGFSIGIWSVLYPSSEQLSAINEMQFRCKDAGIEFRLKEYTGIYRRGDFYGNFSKYPGAVFSDKTINCLCKTSELLIGPDGDVYRCHRDLFSDENPIGNVSHNFELKDKFRKCNMYGQCHPCDVKVKTDYKQRLGHTSVEIKMLE